MNQHSNILQHVAHVHYATITVGFRYDDGNGEQDAFIETAIVPNPEGFSVIVTKLLTYGETQLYRFDCQGVKEYMIINNDLYWQLEEVAPKQPNRIVYTAILGADKDSDAFEEFIGTISNL